jgi:hypothetical protein
MNEFSAAINDLAGAMSFAMMNGSSCCLPCFEEMTRFKILVEMSDRLGEDARSEIEQSICQNLVGADCRGLGFTSWIPEINALRMNAASDRLERAFLAVHASMQGRIAI